MISYRGNSDLDLACTPNLDIACSANLDIACTPNLNKVCTPTVLSTLCKWNKMSAHLSCLHINCIMPFYQLFVKNDLFFLIFIKKNYKKIQLHINLFRLVLYGMIIMIIIGWSSKTLSKTITEDQMLTSRLNFFCFALIVLMSCCLIIDL